MMVTLFKADKKGRLRFFTVHDLQRSLLGGYALTVASSIGEKPGKDILHQFEKNEDRLLWLDRLMARKKKAGYKELYSYGGAVSGLVGQFVRAC